MGRGEKRAGIWRILRMSAVAVGCLALANCSSSKFGKLDPKYGVSSSPRVVADGEPVPKGGGNYRVGKPYVVGGRTYVPEENINYRSEGTASWYGDDFHGRLTANGEVFDMHSISAAHPTLPMPSYVRVTNLANRRSIIVRVNDRGPYAGNRVIDVSVKTAQLLGFHGNGLAQVRVEYVGPAPLQGSDDRQLVATLSQDRPAPTPSDVRVASARPFLPEVTTSAPSERRSVPVPPERPYALGQQMPAQASPQPPPDRGSTEVTSAARPPMQRNARVEASALPPTREPTLASSSGAASRAVSAPISSPVSAYAPIRYDGSAAFMSGRGLY